MEGKPLTFPFTLRGQPVKVEARLRRTANSIGAEIQIRSLDGVVLELELTRQELASICRHASKISAAS